MASRATIALFVALVTISLGSPALAQFVRSHGGAAAAERRGFADRARVRQTRPFIDSNSAAATGGGSEGYNEMLLRD
jgi:hypothetical protein